jgi:hypothetical protein
MQEAKSADSFSTSSPVMKLAMCSAWMPQSANCPRRPPAPDHSASARADCRHHRIGVVAMAEIRDDQRIARDRRAHHRRIWRTIG